MFRFGSGTSAANGNSAGGEDGPRMVPVIIVGIRSVNSNSGAGGSAAAGAGGAAAATATTAATTATATGATAGNGAQTASDGARSFLDSLPLSLGSNAAFGASRSSTGPSSTSAPVGNGSGRRRRRSEDSLDIAGRAESATRQRRGSSMLFDDNDTILRLSDEEDGEGDDGDVMIGDAERVRRAHEALYAGPQEDEEEDEDSSRFSLFPRSGRDRSSNASNLRRRGGHGRRHSPSAAAAAGTGAASEGGSTVRSWIIYVLGGQYPENHPILTTPSLFTDSPTYEDMMLLSSYIGPAKPPVASRESVEEAGGIVVAGEELDGERCLVCLSDFVRGERCRKLNECGHLFHQSCIDEWLTTGRNSCPLCRAVGVAESKDAPSSASGSASEDRPSVLSA
ncbi:hypothetical protein BZA70DRAFT_275087 [Myxozyma melibiosi]|uniref:RING-type domain-containing protein n=1 Tax=Myxozyma melibiosi TaxID=54550 RepID=A0ABR1FAB5_9ASCO